jgi:ABC-type cobalamin/Fe3+-siderophores transport system ATPase subunit
VRDIVESMPLDPRLEQVKPYPALDEALERLVRFVYAQPWPVSPEALRFEAGWDDALVQRAERTELLRREDAGFRPSALALLYMPDDPRAIEELRALQSLATLAAERYRPGAPPLEEAEVLEALDVAPDTMARLARLADDVRLHLFGPEGPWRLQLTERAARHRGLPALFAEAFRGPRDWQNDPAPAPRSGARFDLRLTALHAARFRTLRAFDLRLPSALTVLVGPNGAGKSTALDLCAFVATAGTAGLSAALRDERLSRLRTRGLTGPVEVELEFDVDPGHGRQAGRYGFAFDEVAGEPLVEREWLQLADEVWLDGRRGLAEVRHADGCPVRVYRATGTLTLPTIRDEAAFPVQFNVRRDLRSVVLIDRDPLLRTRGAGRRQPTEIAELLAAIAGDEGRTRALGEALRVFVPTIAGVHRLALTGETPQLEVEEAGLPGTSRFDELSAGMRQLVLLTALYVRPEPPRIILLEEPDAGLHAGALPALRDLLRELARRSTVIATSHAPAFVGLLDPEREVVALERAEGRVLARSLAEALKSRPWLEAFGATGEAFLRAGLERAR